MTEDQLARAIKIESILDYLEEIEDRDLSIIRFSKSGDRDGFEIGEYHKTHKPDLQIPQHIHDAIWQHVKDLKAKLEKEFAEL